jgi:hypothetical protein
MATQDPEPISESASCASVIENRAKEVGLAVFDHEHVTLHLSQFIEPGRSYTSTLLSLDAYAPKKLIIVGSGHHEVAANSGSGVNRATNSYIQVPLPRGMFDDSKGILIIDELSRGACSRGGPAANATGVPNRTVLLKSYYLALGAAGALLQHLITDLGYVIIPGTLQVSHTSL